MGIWTRCTYSEIQRKPTLD